MGYSRKNPRPHDGWVSRNSGRRGDQRLWKSKREGVGGGGGVEPKKIFFRGHFLKLLDL